MIVRCTGRGAVSRPGFVAGAVLAGLTLSIQAAGPAVKAGDRLSDVGGRFAWQVVLPVNFVTSIEAWHLVDHTLYAAGSDGRVRAVDATTGERVWSRRLATPGTRIWPPVSYRSPEATGVVFTLLDEVVVVSPATGVALSWQEIDAEHPDAAPIVHQLDPVELPAGTMAAAAAGAGQVFSLSPKRRIVHLDLCRPDLHERYLSTPSRMDLAPVYVPEIDLLLVAVAG